MRNSTILLLEGRLYSRLYLNQIIQLGIKILFKDGPKKFIKALGLGLLHALLGHEGYIDKRLI